MVEFLSQEDSSLTRQVELIKDLISRLPRGKKMLIFAGSKDNCDSLAAGTGLPKYYHELKDKKSQFTRFLGDANAIISTTSLASDVNLPSLLSKIDKNLMPKKAKSVLKNKFEAILVLV